VGFPAQMEFVNKYLRDGKAKTFKIKADKEIAPHLPVFSATPQS
jgi:hypothetical protein